MQEILSLLDSTLRHDAAKSLNVPADALRIRIPARAYDAGCPLAGLGSAAETAPLPEPTAFTPVLGVPPVAAVERKNGWLYFTLSDSFYTALVQHILTVLPAPDTDLNSLALNRMLCLSRRGGTGCPPVRSVQRALLLTLCAGQSPAALRRAEQALLTMMHPIAPKARAALYAVSGGAADAAARILFDQRTRRFADS